MVEAGKHSQSFYEEMCICIQCVIFYRWLIIHHIVLKKGNQGAFSGHTGTAGICP
jgi:hypothetical protein